MRDILEQFINIWKSVLDKTVVSSTQYITGQSQYSISPAKDKKIWHFLPSSYGSKYSRIDQEKFVEESL